MTLLPVFLWEPLPVIVKHLEASDNLLGQGPLLRFLIEPSLLCIKNFVERVAMSDFYIDDKNLNFKEKV